MRAQPQRYFFEAVRPGYWRKAIVRRSRCSCHEPRAFAADSSGNLKHLDSMVISLRGSWFCEGQSAVRDPVGIIAGVGDLSLVFMIGHCGEWWGLEFPVED